MTTTLRFFSSLLLLPFLAACAGPASAPPPAPAPRLSGVGAAMQKYVDAKDIAGTVTVVTTKDKIVHLEITGQANIEKNESMRPDTVFWLASMTKPITAVALLMCQDDGKLKVTDPVSKYIPEFASLKTPSGKPANLTIRQIMTHTSGLGEAGGPAAAQAHTLADLVPLFLAAPMQYEPGAQWKYTQSGINVGSRLVEIASGMPFDVFVQKRILDPLGMKNTTFWPTTRPELHRAVGYTKNRTTGNLEANPPSPSFGVPGHPPLGNGGLFSTGPDYAHFCQMLLGGGVYHGKRYLSPEAMKLLMTVQTGDLRAGFIGGHEDAYGWGFGVGIMKKQHPGVGAMLNPGSYGHGGAWGTQAWIDPTRGVAYILMVQRPNVNGDASDLRRDFQQAASDALK